MGLERRKNAGILTVLGVFFYATSEYIYGEMRLKRSIIKDLQISEGSDYLFFYFRSNCNIKRLYLD